MFVFTRTTINMANTTTQPATREELLDYIKSHIELENIELDIADKFGTNDLDDLDDDQLYWVAVWYDYLED